MTNAMSNETEGAMVKAINDLDASRRVGWGRAYGAAEKLAETERDLNMARSDRDLYRRGMSFLYGFIQGYFPAKDVSDMAAWIAQLMGHPDEVLDDVVRHKGAQVGAASYARSAFRAEMRTVKQEARRSAAQQSNRMFEKASQQAVKRIAKHYKIPNTNLFFDHLDKYFGVRTGPVSKFMRELAEDVMGDSELLQVARWLAAEASWFAAEAAWRAEQ